MRTLSICLVAATLLFIPIVGQVQQAPANAQVPSHADSESAIANLRALMKAQTEAIQALQSRVVTLETRVEKLEKGKTAAGGT